MHICNKIVRKFTFKCDFVENGLYSAMMQMTFSLPTAKVLFFSVGRKFRFGVMIKDASINNEVVTENDTKNVTKNVTKNFSVLTVYRLPFPFFCTSL